MTSSAPYLLGISAWYHDSAAVLLHGGEIVAAAQEERFSRRKNDPAFPKQAIAWCLERAGLQLSDVAYITYYDKPFIKFERLLETALQVSPHGLPFFCKAMPSWIKDKLFLKSLLRKELAAVSGGARVNMPSLLFTTHHQAHAASAFYASPFEESAVLCLDGVGEWVTSSAWHGKGATLQPLWQQDFPHSLGLLYSALTWYCGFKVNSGEYKLMGLAPYGEPRYLQRMLDNLIDIKADGSYRLNMEYFGWCEGEGMLTDKFMTLFEGPPRVPETWLTQRDMDLAASVQKLLETVVVRMASALQRETQQRRLCMAGGVALNCVANSQILKQAGFDEVWVQPAAGDAGGALGAALCTWHHYLGEPHAPRGSDRMQGALLGPSFSDPQIESELQRQGAAYRKFERAQLLEQTAALLAKGQVVGWFQGAAEFGPRALGARSILGDPREQAMQTRLNVKIKFRESFRPFAPAVLAERQQDYFDFRQPSPYMLFTAPVTASRRLPESKQVLSGIERLKHHRSELPAITHVDYSARLQTVAAGNNPIFHSLLCEFQRQTGCGVLVNTSFNVRGEPIVGSPLDAWRCFMKTDMDHLVIGSYLLDKQFQPPLKEQPVPEPVFTLNWRSLSQTALQRWIAFGTWLSRYTTPVVLGSIYLLLVCPLGWWRRRQGGHPAFGRPDPALKTYRQSAQPLDRSDMEHPY